MFSVTGRTMLVTGGAMGMGRLFCEHGVAEGAKVIIWDIDEQAMAETAAALTERGGTVHTYKVDVSSRKAIEKATQKVLAEHAGVDIVFNNAGIVTGNGYFWENTPEQIERTMRINGEALMHVCHGFLPGMLEQRCGRIVNMCSGAGLFAMPRLAAYCSSKHAAVGWSDSLRLELSQAGYVNVCVTTVTPGHINTGMFDGFDSPALTPTLEPEYLAGKVWESMKNGAVAVRAPWSIYLALFLKGLLPVRLFDWIGGVLGTTRCMENFRGRPVPKPARKTRRGRAGREQTGEKETA